jgi:hypothetical protein
MNSITSYASGGLCNRLLPFASCLSYARRRGIKPIICWEKTSICHADYCDLFEQDDVEIVNKNQLKEKIDTLFLLSVPDVYQDFSLYGNPSLKELFEDDDVKKYPINLFSDDKYENCCVYSNSFIDSIETLDLSKNALKSIKIKKEIQDKIDEFVKNNQINKDWISIHARGTDFANASISEYINIIQKLIYENSNVKIFFCSDEPSWEQEVVQKYPNNIIFREKQSITIAVDKNKNTWINNTFRSSDQVKEALIDVSLLAKCGKIIYNKESSFGKLATFLGS